MRLKQDYPLFYRHETFAKRLIASQGANIPAHMCQSCACQGTGAHGEVRQSIRGSKDGGELWTKDSEVLRRDSENVKLFRRCEFGFGGVLGGSDGRWVV
jgi:hypothetical protein